MNQDATTPGRASGPSFPQPVSPDYTEAARSAELTPMFGHCAPWCLMDGPNTGQPLAEHGRMCESRGFHVDAWGGHQDHRIVWASLVEPYHHGVYAAEDVNGRPSETFVQLVWEDPLSNPDRVYGAFVSPAQARSLAAALLRLADTAEGHDVPMYRQGGAR